MPKEYDAGGRAMKAEMNHLRSQLDVLGISTKNLYQRIPTFDPTGKDPVVSPINGDPELRSIVNKMDDMGMSSDVLTERSTPGPSKQSLQHAKTAGGENFALFDAFKRYYYATTKKRFVATDDMIGASDARSIQNMIKSLNKGKVIQVGKVTAKARELSREIKQLELLSKKEGFKDLEDLVLNSSLGNETHNKILERYTDIIATDGKLDKLTVKDVIGLSDAEFALYERIKSVPHIQKEGKEYTPYDYDLTMGVDVKNAVDLLKAYRTRGNTETADMLKKKLLSEIKIIEKNDMLDKKEIASLKSKISKADSSKEIKQYKQIGGIKDVGELYNYLDDAVAATYERFKDTIYDTQSTIMGIISDQELAYTPGEKRSNNLGTIPEGIAFNADLKLHASAKEGKLEWLVKNGKKLKGQEAIEELSDVEVAVNRINEASLILFNAKSDKNYKNITNPEMFRQ